MLTHPTSERLRSLGLVAMAQALEEQRRQPDLDGLGFEERLALLVEREATGREDKKLRARLKFAGLRQSACVEDIDWRAARALGHKACRDGRSVLYHRLPRLLEALGLARGDGRYARMLKGLAREQLLILDDWGLAPLTAEQRRDLLEIVDDRHGRAATIVTSQLPVPAWHEWIADPTLGDAILDRLVHNAHRIELKGESMRRRAACRAIAVDADQEI